MPPQALNDEETTPAHELDEEETDSREFARQSAVVATGWLATNIGLALATLPLRFVLKDQVGLTPAGLAGFFAIGNGMNYVKPFAGVLTDSIPLCGTRRRHYLVFSLLVTGILWIVLSLVPRTYWWMLAVYLVMYTGVVFTSTTLGGVMVEVGTRFKAAGRLTAQRIACFKIGELAGGPLGGWLATFPFTVAATVGGALHLALIPFLILFLPNESPAKLNTHAWQEVARQGRVLIRNRTLLGAAGMICLLVISPGVNTALFYHQTNVLGFDSTFVGFLLLISAAAGMLSSGLYFYLCRRMELKTLVAASIVIHTLGGLCYLGYRSAESAMIISAIAGLTSTMALLPVYDIAARATPKGSEAIGYSVMMSVSNATHMLGDFIGASIFEAFGRNLTPLIWIDAISTFVVIFAVPFMPKALSRREDQVPATVFDAD